eukprot:TRINITY_DN1991_c0_g1_i2.p1 TRINITY_DN1991_c0_g1~~TRINITY_DN1991_c0_g1_i2.p1  ORF type:complete len:319 (+),score=109.78 TRINITY_DN1991_c0_g1_i2:102-1058(+)
MIRRPPRSTLSSSSAASDVYKRQVSTQSTGSNSFKNSMDLAQLLQAGGLGGLGGLGQQQQQPAANKNSVQFRAGKMERRGTTVTADKRKGYVRVYKDENQLTHFTWKERTKQAAEMDLMLFPDDAEAFMLPQPPATGRCFALRLKAANRVHFFWLQEPSESKDAELITQMNEILNPGSSTSAPAPDNSDNTSTAAQASGPSEMEVDPVVPGDSEEEAALQAALAMSMQEDEPAPETSAPAATTETAEAGDDDEEAALQAALAMSMQTDEESSTPAPAAPAPEPSPVDDMDEDAALQAAIAMSMQEDKPATDDDSDLYD